MLYQVGTIVNQYSAVWSNSAVCFLINSAVSSIIPPFGFVFIRPSGFSRMDKYPKNVSKPHIHYSRNKISIFDPPASEASMKVANLTERKNLHTPVYGAKEFVCLSVCMWSTLTGIISGLAEQTEAAIFFRQSMGTQNGNFTKDYLIFH